MSNTQIILSDRFGEQQLAEQALKLAIASTSDGVALLDANSKYTYLNSAHVKQFGYEDEAELLGRTWHVFYRPVEIDRIERDIFPLLMANGSWRGETVGVKKSGEPIYQEITLTALPDGGLICVTRILDKLKEVERQLASKNASITSIISQVTAGLLLEDSHRYIIEANEKLGQLIELNLDPNILRGTNCVDGLQVVKNQMKEPARFLKRIEELVANKLPVYNELVELASGRFLERDFLPVLDGDSVQGFLWVYRDITDHQTAKRSLERLVVREQEMNEMRSKLVRTVSHEFKKPIFNTLTSIQLLQGQLKNSGQNIYSRAFDHIIEELQGLNTSVTKLVKYEALLDRSEAVLKPVYTKNLIKNYLNYNYKLFVLSEKFKITDVTESELVLIDIDLFNLALKNIIDNALKYTEHNEQILVESKVLNGCFIVEFCNPLMSGNRPDQSQLGKVLYRANPKDDKGLGLGLGIIQHAASLMQGFVSYSVDETDYCLKLSLPLYLEEK